MTHRWLALGVLSLGVLLIGVDGTALAVAAPTFGRDLGMTATQILWIGDIYSFVLAGLLVNMGSSVTVSDTRSYCSAAPPVSPSRRWQRPTHRRREC